MHMVECRRAGDVWFRALFPAPTPTLRGEYSKMKTLSETLKRGNNNFDLIRLVASLAVMLGHSYGVQSGQMESMLMFTHRESFGSLAVYGFFMISGMLVSASFASQPTVSRFIALRALRIWPGAMVCAAFIGLVVGPLLSSVSLAAYFSSPQTLHWLIHNISLVGRVGGPLPGLFDANHLKNLVNATVWTLPVELKCYVIVLLAGLLGVIGSKRLTLFLVLTAGVIFAMFANHPPKYFSLGDFFLLQFAYSFYPVPFFLLGMLLYAFRDHVRLCWVPALLLTLAYVFSRFSFISAILLYPAFAYGLLWLASADFLKKIQPKHDYSYGVYLYGFVVQQVVASISPSLNNYLAFFISVPVTVVLAALSWHLVERPSLSNFRRFSAARAQSVSGA
jgi:peptidoglycan/LPS O-acetylase OafA/YrhL